MKTVIEPQKYLANTCIFWILLCEFYNKQESNPVILLPMNANLKISIDNTILPFSLVMCPRIKKLWWFCLNTKKITSQKRELWFEQTSSSAHDWLQKIIILWY